VVAAALVPQRGIGVPLILKTNFCPNRVDDVGNAYNFPTSHLCLRLPPHVIPSVPVSPDGLGFRVLLSALDPAQVTGPMSQQYALFGAPAAWSALRSIVARWLLVIIEEGYFAF